MKNISLTIEEKKAVYQDMCVNALGAQPTAEQFAAWNKLVGEASGTANADFDKMVAAVCEAGKGSKLSADELSSLSLKLNDCHN